MQQQTIAFLGPLGTYSHLITKKHFGKTAELIPLSGILEVCSFVARHKDAKGIIPIENSSGGTIHETIDILLNNRPRIFIEGELTLHVRLALLGHKGCPIRKLHSHFVPLEHCSPWIKRNLGRVSKVEEPSTAIAAAHVTVDPYAAALGGRHLAKQFGLSILTFPVESETPNITSFIIISGRKTTPAEAAKTTLAVRLPNKPGSLYQLLGIFDNERINLSRLVSRPIRGRHKEYAFLVDIDGGIDKPALRKAVREAKKASVSLRVCGSYPCFPAYRS